MRRVVLFVGVACSLVADAARADRGEQPGTGLRIAPLPDVHAAPSAGVASDPEKARIKKAIAALAKTDRPDFGFSSTVTGWAFAPISTQRHAGALLLTDHGMQTPSAIVDLVAAGPKALPFLLDCLDDKTPTQVKIEHHNDYFGGIWPATELEGNRSYPPEAEAMARHAEKQGGRSSRPHLKSYRVTVGDICFVALGQIVGRGYQAVRYQPTAIIMINSPAHDAQFARSIRSLWSGDDPANLLFRSLLRGFSTVATVDAGTDGEISHAVARHLQTEAALRLLFYFPTEAAPLVAQRIRQLDLTSRFGTADFLEAVAWSREPAVEQALSALKKRTTDAQLLKIIDAGRAVSPTRW